VLQSQAGILLNCNVAARVTNMDVAEVLEAVGQAVGRGEFREVRSLAALADVL